MNKKKLSIKEKASRYDEALAHAKLLLKIIGNATLGNLVLKNEFENMFHELRESEDDRTRKDIVTYLKSDIANKGYRDKIIESWIDWLEKQGEKTEPIEDFDTEFERQISHLIASAINREHEYNKGYVKWAAQSLIEYAKREIEKQGEQKPVMSYDALREGITHFGITQYQIDNWLKKYVDVEKQWEKKPADEVKPKFKIGDTIIKKHNSDILYFGSFTITDITGGKYWYNDRIICDITEQDEWELYEPVSQKSAEWSEEDDEHLERILKELESQRQRPINTPCLDKIESDYNWLKSLKDRYTWKPSDLPHWKKSTLPDSNTTGFNSDYFCHKGYCINYKELFEKLPKDD